MIKPLWFEGPVVPATIATEDDAANTDNETSDDTDDDEEMEDNLVENHVFTDSESECEN